MHAPDYANMTTVYDQQKRIIPYYLLIISILPIVGAICALFLSFVIIWKTKQLNGHFRRGLVYSLLCPTTVSVYLGHIFKPYSMLPFEVVWTYGFFPTAMGTWVHIMLLGCLSCLYTFSMIFLAYVYVKAFSSNSILSVGSSIKVFLISGVCFIVFSGLVLMYMSYTQLSKKAVSDANIVMEGNPNNSFFFKELGGYVFNLEQSGLFAQVQYASVVFWSVAAILLGATVFLRIIIILHKRRSDVSQATAKLQKTFVTIVVVHVVIFVAFYGFPFSAVFCLNFTKFFFIANYPLFPMFVVQMAFLPVGYSIVNLLLVKQIRKGFFQLFKWKRSSEVRNTSASIISRHQSSRRTETEARTTTT